MNLTARGHVARASAMSASQMRNVYGVEEFSEKVEKIEHAVTRINEIKEGIENLARIKEKSVLKSLGIEIPDSEDEEEMTSESKTDSEIETNLTDQSQDQVTEPKPAGKLKDNETTEKSSVDK